MEITKEEFEAYEAVRASGLTNMWHTSMVSELSGLSKETITEIMRQLRSSRELRRNEIQSYMRV